MVTMFLIVILPTFAASIILLSNMRTIIREATFNEALNYSDIIEYRLTTAIESTEADIGEIVKNQSIIDFLENNYKEKSEFYNYYYRNYSNLTYNDPHIKRVIIYSERDDFVYASNYYHADEEIQEESWYIKALSNPTTYIWDVITNPADGKKYLACVQAIRGTYGIAGVAVTLLSDEWVKEIIPKSTLITVLSVEDGSVYYSNGEYKAGDRINTSENYLDHNIRGVFDYGVIGDAVYTVINNFRSESRFQIFILMSSGFVNYEVNRLSVVYGGYCALMIILSMLIIILFTSVFTRRIRLLSEKMHSVAGGNFDVEFNDKGNDEIADLYTDLGQMIKDMQRLIDDNYQVKLQSEAFKFNQMEAEFKALASQINPHFLYNTLETIRMKAFCNNDKETADLVKKLGKFMRRCLEFKDGEVTLHSELEFTNSYLELQSARFGDRVSYRIYSEVSKDYMILPLLIQPIVENAFVHGIEGSKSNGRIDIKVYYHDEFVIVDVIDNGCGMSPEKLKELEDKLILSDTASGKSIGMSNVNKRIKMYHGEKYGMFITSKQGSGTTVQLKLPREGVNCFSLTDKRCEGS